jgi:transposase
MNKRKALRIVQEREVRGTSFRTLAKKYGISHSRIYRMVKQEETGGLPKGKEEEELPDDVKQLKELLRKERLKTELLNNIIDIADKELGTNIRKKSGTRRSE